MQNGTQQRLSTPTPKVMTPKIEQPEARPFRTVALSPCLEAMERGKARGLAGRCGCTCLCPIPPCMRPR